MTSILIDPVEFLKGSSWTGSYEIWMEVTNKKKVLYDAKSLYNIILQGAPNLEVLALSIAGVHAVFSLEYAYRFLKNWQVFYWNYNALKNAELNENLKIEKNEKELSQVCTHE